MGIVIDRRAFRQQRKTLFQGLFILESEKMLPADAERINLGLGLSQWMKDNLILYFYPNSDCASLEGPLINEFNPPLNLLENHNPINAEFRNWLTSRRTRKI